MAGSAAAVLLWRLLRAYVLGRLMRGGRRAGRRRAYAYPRRRQRPVRFVGPFPTYSTRFARDGDRLLPAQAAVAVGVRALSRR